MKFENELLIFAMPIITFLLVWLFVRNRKLKTKFISEFVSKSIIEQAVQNFSQKKDKTRSVLCICAFSLLIHGLAGPKFGSYWVEKKSVGVDIIFAVDVSKSMLAEDIRPNRLERVKLELASFSQKLVGNRLGLIAFAGSAFLQCPLTLDYSAFLQSVDALDVNVIANGGTALDKAVSLADNAFQSTANQKILILISDGEELTGDVFSSLKYAKNLKIFTVGVGEEKGSKLPIIDENGRSTFIKDIIGRDVISKLNRDLLEKIATTTKGFYVPLSADGLNLINTRYISKFEKNEVNSRQEQVQIERFQWFVLPAIILLLIEQVISTRKSTIKPVFKSIFRRFKKIVPLIIAVVFVNVAGAVQSKGDKCFSAGDYINAEKIYEKMLIKDSNRYDVEYNLGTDLLKTGDFETSKNHLNNAIKSSDFNVKKNAFYNIGHACFAQGEATIADSPDQTLKFWDDSLKAFENALELDENFDNASKNYLFVKQKIDELKKQQENKSGSGEGQKQTSKDQENNDINDQKNDPSDSNNNTGNPAQNEQDDNQNDDDAGKDSAENNQSESDSDSKENSDNQQKNHDQETSAGDQSENGQQNSSNDQQTEQNSREMSLQEAEMLLDEFSSQEKKLPVILDNNEHSHRNGKDW